jgi:hypothetical protein
VRLGREQLPVAGDPYDGTVRADVTAQQRHPVVAVTDEVRVGHRDVTE